MNKRSALIFSAGLFLLAVAFFIIFISNGSVKKEGDIVLPQGSAQLTENVDIAQRNNEKMLEASIDATNVQSVIKSLERPSEYELVAEIAYYYDNQSKIFTSTLWSSGSLQRGRIEKQDGNLERNVLKTADNVYIWGEKSDTYYRGPANKLTIEDEIRMPTYESVLQLSVDSILDAKTTQQGGRFCIYIKSEHEEGKIVREWYIDVANALLISCDTRENGELIYAMNCKSLNVEKQNEDLFAIPTVSIPNN